MKPVVVASLVFAATVAVTACSGKEPASAAAPAQTAPPPMDVKTVTLQPKPVAQSSEFVATIRSLRSITIQPQVEGFVRQILVKGGERVRAGQPLVQIDPDRQQAAANVIESQRAARQVDLEFAQQDLARVRQLAQEGIVSKADLDRAETAYKSAEAQLKSVQSQIRENDVQLQYYRVVAPADGIVGDIPVRQGDRVTNSTLITTIDQASGLEVYINVPLERAVDLKPGLRVELLNSDGQVLESSTITFIAPRADDATQSVLAKAALRQAPPGVRVMQYVRARIIWSNDPALVVPVVAVTRLAGQHFVFVAEPMQQAFVARQKPITVGAIIGDDYVVRAGLTPGDRVIVSNVQKIGDGSPVKPAASEPAESNRPS
jgi:RND family efflux transporter MFP subunit